MSVTVTLDDSEIGSSRLLGQAVDRVKCKCGEVANEIIYAERKVRQGWYCETCGRFYPAKNRERKL